MKCTLQDCFNCPYPDCIDTSDEDMEAAKKLSAKQKKAIRDKKWAEEHQDYIKDYRYNYYRDVVRPRLQKQKFEKELAKMKECAYCHKPFKVGYILKYRGRYFHEDGCLEQYLLDKEEEHIEQVWHDTEENMRIAAEEEWNEY